MFSLVSKPVFFHHLSCGGDTCGILNEFLGHILSFGPTPTGLTCAQPCSSPNLFHIFSKPKFLILLVALVIHLAYLMLGLASLFVHTHCPIALPLPLVPPLSTTLSDLYVMDTNGTCEVFMLLMPGKLLEGQVLAAGYHHNSATSEHIWKVGVRINKSSTRVGLHICLSSLYTFYRWFVS